MKGFLSLFFLLSCGIASAQHSRGFLLFAPGGATAAGHTERTYHLGGGFEGIVLKRFGLGVELGALGPGDHFSDGVFGVFSINGYYHFPHSRRKVDPLATAGYSLAFGRGTGNLFNFGGGLNYWFRPGTAILLEFRDHVWPRFGVTAHYWGFRVGLSFRL